MNLSKIPYFLTLLLLFRTTGLSGQGITWLQDPQRRLWIFDKGKTKMIEDLPFTQIRTGSQYVVFADANNNFRLYFRGNDYKVLPMIPPEYVVTEHLVVAKNRGNSATIFHGPTRRAISQHAPEKISIGDSLIAYVDNLGSFNIFYEDSFRLIDNRTIESFKAYDNIVVYRDPSQIVRFYWRGESQILEQNYPPLSYKAEEDIIAYVDYLGYFKCFLNGEWYDLESIRPKEYWVGDRMTVYITFDDRLKVFYDGEETELLLTPPKKIHLADNMLAYTDQSGFLFGFYDGEIFPLETYTPDTIIVDYNILVYPTFDNKLKGLDRGVEVNITQGQVFSYYRVANQTVLFYQTPNRQYVYWNRRIYDAY